jgi:Tol biopolymer transport system component
VTFGETDDAIVNWSRDGQRVYFNSNRTGRYEIWSVPVSGGDARQVTREGGYYAVETPDGKELLYSLHSDPGPLRKLSFESGKDVELAALVWPLCFAAIADGVAFIPADIRPGETVIRHLNLRTGRQSTIAKLANMISAGITVSPDEKTLLFSQRDQIGSDLALVNGLK